MLLAVNNKIDYVIWTISRILNEWHVPLLFMSIITGVRWLGTVFTERVDLVNLYRIET